MSDIVFFIDSCIIFNRILEEDITRTNKFFNDVTENRIKCYVNESVKNECDIKIDDTFNFLINTLKNALRGSFLEHFRRQRRDENSELSYDDIKLLEQIFINRYYIPRYGGQRRWFRRPLISTVKSVENFVAIFLEKELDNNEVITLLTFFKNITDELMKYEIEVREKYEDIEEEFYDLEYINEPVSPMLFQGLTQHDLHRSDCIHLLAMSIYSTKNSLNSIFVTGDYGILRQKYILKSGYNIMCSNPLYAINYTK